MPNALQQALILQAPILGLFEVDETAGGRQYHTPILQRGPVGRSHTYSDALANAAGSRTEAFDVTYVENYQIGKLTGNVIRRSKGKENALEEALDHEVEAAIVNMKKDLRRGFFGNTGGSRGRISSVASAVVTLTNKQDAINFETGMEICVASTDGTSGSLRDSGQAVTLSAVNRPAGTITADENWSEISGTTANDYLFAKGDFGADVAGLTGWVPQSAPGATAWYGVDRSVDDRLGGLRFTGTGQPIEDAIMEASGYAHQFDANCDVAICDPITWTKVAKSLGSDRSNRVVVISDSKGIVGYSAIMVATQLGMIPLVSDPGCPADTVFLLDKSTWVIASVGPLVQIIDDDGLLIRRSTTADEWNFEVLFSGNLCCRAPGKNVNIQIA